MAAGLLLYYEDLLKKMDFIYAAQLLTRLPESLPSDELFALVETVPAHVPSCLGLRGPEGSGSAAFSLMANRTSPSGFQMIGSSAPAPPSGQKSFSQLVLEVRAQLEPHYRATCSASPSNSLSPSSARVATSNSLVRTSSNASSVDSHLTPTLRSRSGSGMSSCGSLHQVAAPGAPAAAGEQSAEHLAVQV